MKQSLGAVLFAYPATVFLVGTYDQAGKANIMPVAWGGICCVQPLCVAISLRTATHTFACVVARQAFTLNLPATRQAALVDYCGLATGRTTDKFAQTRLTPVRSRLVDAPTIKECALTVECEVVHTFALGLHTQFVGMVRDVKADPKVLKADGGVDVRKVKPLIFLPDTREYYGVGEWIGQAFALGASPRRSSQRTLTGQVDTEFP